MNCGFEDCVVLDVLIEKHREHWPAILSEYQELRKPDADAIADLAIANFVEMRDTTADPKFQLKKQVTVHVPVASRSVSRPFNIVAMLEGSDPRRKAEAVPLGPSLWVVAADTLELPVQVDGKLRDRLVVTPDTPAEEIERMALASEHVQRYLAGRAPLRVVQIPGRLVNVVTPKG